jgi:hypothetical protein
MCVSVLANRIMNSLIYGLLNDIVLWRGGWEWGTQQEYSYTRHAVTNRIPGAATLARVNEALHWNVWPRAKTEPASSTAKHLFRGKCFGCLAQKQTDKVSKITGCLEICYSWGAYVHNWVKWLELESDHKPLYNVEIMCGAIILSLCMSVWGI